MKFYIDEDISQKIAEILRENNVDAVSAHEVGRGGSGISDEEQLAYASTEGKCLVTYNGRHYITLTSKFFEKEWKHAGLIIIPSSMPSDNFEMISRSLIEYARQHREDMPPYSYDFSRTEKELLQRKRA
ncbi:MAG: DUF5615 family PIN-like protein [Nitrospirota bacterium]